MQYFIWVMIRGGLYGEILSEAEEYPEDGAQGLGYVSLYTLTTVVSGRKAIVGLRHPVTIGLHISTEISKTSHPRDLQFLPLARNT